MTEPTGVSARRGPLRAGQRVQIKDAKGRLNTITLLPGGEFHSYQGVLRHDDLIGGFEGVVVENSAGRFWPEPPVPVPVGSPPCTTKPSITRWNGVPS